MLEAIVSPMPDQIRHRTSIDAQRAILAATSLVLLTLWFWLMQWSLFEIGRVIIGLLMLWLPVGGLLFLLLHGNVKNGIVRATLSAIGSYALTTLIYFVVGHTGIAWVFYVVESAIAFGVAGVVGWRYKRAEARHPTGRSGSAKFYNRFATIDWLLICLICGSLVAAIPLSTSFTTTANGDRVYAFFGDQTYLTSLAYELGRGVPPIQQSIEAGIAERPYHLLPHVTTLLISDYTGQSDMVRAHLVYHYAIIAVLLCLVVYCIASTLARTRWAGYIGVALLYILAVPFPALQDSPIGYFFASLYPYVTSSLEPTALTSPQMYSATVVVFGVLLGVLVLTESATQHLIAPRLLLIVTLIVLALERFRVQAFLPIISGYLLFLAWLWLRSRQRIYIYVAFLTVIGSLLLYAEMLLPTYQANTAKLSLSYNGLTAADNVFFNAWPGASTVRIFIEGAVGSTDPKQSLTALWLWQVVSISAFVIFNILGFPFVLAFGFYLRRSTVWQEWGIYIAFSLWLVIAAVVGAITLAMNYDSYSVGGQMPLHIYWYLLPFTAVLLWRVAQRIGGRWPMVQRKRYIIAIVVLVVGAGTQIAMQPTPLRRMLTEHSVIVTAAEVQAINYIRGNTPQNAIIINNSHREPNFAIYSGLAGRADYIEYLGNSLNVIETRKAEAAARVQMLSDLWTTSDPAIFCTLVHQTPATLLIENAQQPLGVRNVPCLQQVFVAGNDLQQVTVWNIRR